MTVFRKKEATEKIYDYSPKTRRPVGGMLGCKAYNCTVYTGRGSMLK